MAPNATPQILLLFSSLLFLKTSSLSLPSNETVYDILPKFGLPPGLLPNNVKSYTLQNDGVFEVELEKECYVEFEYQVFYEKTISGVLKYGSITDLKGIQVKRFYFVWFDVDEIKVDLPPSDYIYFTVGIINKKLDVTQFQTVHACGDNLRNCAFHDDELKTPVDEIQMLVME